MAKISSLSPARARIAGVAPQCKYSGGLSVVSVSASVASSAEDELGTIKPLDFAELYAYRKDSDRAFEWLERQYKADPDTLRTGIRTDPFFVQMREDPRYKALIRKLHLPE
jgi:hypothetical protein